MTEIMKFSVFLLWILQCLLGETAHVCPPNLICVHYGECEIQVNEGDILFPCTKGICCPKLKNSITTTTRRYESFNTIKTTSYDDIYIDYQNKREGTTPPYEYINGNTPHINRVTREKYTLHSTNNNIFSKNCGLTNSQDRITGGKIAELGQFPWIALIGFKHNLSQSLQFPCGGSLITRRDVLTAAHCIVENRHLELSSIRLGEYNLTTDRDCVGVGKYKICADPHIDVGIDKVTVHPMFNRKTFKNDIAIIRISREVEMTDFISTICLPFDKDYSNIDMTGKNFIVSGWGKSNNGDLFGTNEIQYAKVTAWDPIKCNNSLPPEVKPLSPTQFCANGPKSQDACKGDSGGPLINVDLDRDLEVKHIQFGIISFGSGTCGDKNLPSVYTRVDKYLDWITKTVS